MSARDVAFTLMALGHVAGCRGKTATEILAEAVGEIVRLQTELTAKSDAYRDNIATWMTKYGDKAAECHELREERDRYKRELDEARETVKFLNGACRDSLGLSACD